MEALVRQLKEHIDGDGLIRLEHLLDAFNYCGQGVFKSKHNQLSVVLHSFFRRSYSIYNNYNFGFLDKLFEVYNNGNHSVKVRLDTNLIGFAPSWRQSHEYEFWYGPKYNDDIESIPEGLTRYESDEIDKVYTNIKSTEFIWQKKDDGKQYQFEMEEVTDVEAPTLEKDTYGCRYLHALYDFDHKEFNHFDGAIRCYDLEKMIERIDTPMNQMGHQAEYTKIFRIDGHISLDLWKSLITQYLCSNHSVYDYFGIPRPFPKPQKEEPKGKKLKDYVPYQIDKTTSRYGQKMAARRVARTIMLGSAPTVRAQSIRGIEASRIRLGVVQPGENIADFDFEYYLIEEIYIFGCYY